MTSLKNSYSHTYATTQRAIINLSLSENPLGPSPNTTGIWTECIQLFELAELSPIPALILEAGADVNCSLYPDPDPGLDQYIHISPQKHLINKKFILILKKIQRGK